MTAEDFNALQAAKQLSSTSIREAMEPARFIGPKVYIDTETDWGDIEPCLSPPTAPEGNFIPVSFRDPNNWPPHIHPLRTAEVREVQ